MDKDDKLKVVFAPGCFDHLDLTQEELDQLVTDITEMVESGNFFEVATPVDIDDLPDDQIEKINAFFTDQESRSKLLH